MGSRARARDEATRLASIKRRTNCPLDKVSVNAVVAAALGACAIHRRNRCEAGDRASTGKQQRPEGKRALSLSELSTKELAQYLELTRALRSAACEKQPQEDEPAREEESRADSHQRRHGVSVTDWRSASGSIRRRHAAREAAPLSLHAGALRAWR